MAFFDPSGLRTRIRLKHLGDSGDADCNDGGDDGKNSEDFNQSEARASCECGQRFRRPRYFEDVVAVAARRGSG